MSKKASNQSPESFELIEETLSKTEQFIEDNQKIITSLVAVIVVIVGGYLAYQKFYKAPLEQEAQSQMFIAEQYFERDSFNLAINGDGNYDGFLDIIDEYGSTKCGNLAQYYAGISYLKLAKYDEAIEYLSSFNSDDKMIAPVATAAIGDAYLEKGDKEKAVDYYIQAAGDGDNSFTSPIFLMKAGAVYETLNDYSSALEVYERVKADYPKSTEGRKVEKYITRVNGKLN